MRALPLRTAVLLLGCSGLTGPDVSELGKMVRALEMSALENRLDLFYSGVALSEGLLGSTCSQAFHAAATAAPEMRQRMVMDSLPSCPGPCVAGLDIDELAALGPEDRRSRVQAACDVDEGAPWLDAVLLATALDALDDALEGGDSEAVEVKRRLERLEPSLWEAARHTDAN